MEAELPNGERPELVTVLRARTQVCMETSLVGQRRRSITVPDLPSFLPELQRHLAGQEKDNNDDDKSSGLSKSSSGSANPKAIGSPNRNLQLRAACEEVVETNSVLQQWFSGKDHAEGTGVGAPAPRTADPSRKPELMAQRLNAMMEVSKISAQYLKDLEAQRQVSISRRTRRLKTAPSSSSILSSVHDASTSPSCSLNSAAAAALASLSGEDNSPVILFDWDDTLLSTWYATEVVKPCLQDKDLKVSPFWEPLRAHGEVVNALLTAAREVGRVAIITLAKRPWIETSASLYLPDLDIVQLFNNLGIEVYYAREHVSRAEFLKGQTEEGVDMFMIAKRNAMLACMRKMYGRSTAAKHIISIGDSPAEAEALREILWCQSGANLCKTVKLMSDPSVRNLSDELQVLSSWLSGMITFKEDFDITMESAEDILKISSTFA